jgi:mycothiol synthase
VAVRNTVAPYDPAAVESLRRDRETLRLLAFVDGAVAGAGFATRSDIRGAAFVNCWVPADRRRRGIGSALLAALSEHALGLGVSGLRTRTIEDEVGAIAFLAHHGFVEVARECELRLDLGTAAPLAAASAPADVEIHSLGARLDLAPQVHELAMEGQADVPTEGTVVVPPFEEWRRENVDEALLDGSFVAVAGSRVVGWAGLTSVPASPGVAEHLLTAVARPSRRRGVARALKTAQIDWARRAGYRELVTYNAELNAPMRRLNEALGYVPRPEVITFRRPAPAERS